MNKKMTIGALRRVIRETIREMVEDPSADVESTPGVLPEETAWLSALDNPNPNKPLEKGLQPGVKSDAQIQTPIGWLSGVWENRYKIPYTTARGWLHKAYDAKNLGTGRELPEAVTPDNFESSKGLTKEFIIDRRPFLKKFFAAYPKKPWTQDDYETQVKYVRGTDAQGNPGSVE